MGSKQYQLANQTGLLSLLLSPIDLYCYYLACYYHGFQIIPACKSNRIAFVCMWSASHATLSVAVAEAPVVATMTNMCSLL